MVALNVSVRLRWPCFPGRLRQPPVGRCRPGEASKRDRRASSLNQYVVDSVPKRPGDGRTPASGSCRSNARRPRYGFTFEAAFGRPIGRCCSCHRTVPASAPRTNPFARRFEVRYRTPTKRGELEIASVRRSGDAGGRAGLALHLPGRDGIKKLERTPRSARLARWVKWRPACARDSESAGFRCPGRFRFCGRNAAQQRTGTTPWKFGAP